MTTRARIAGAAKPDERRRRPIAPAAAAAAAASAVGLTPGQATLNVAVMAIFTEIADLNGEDARICDLRRRPDLAQGKDMFPLIQPNPVRVRMPSL